ncbi:MAG: right-handed parallel beta-helix repeat-containing protein [Polyangiaceae bacterium]|nr:right-handed parallel beta-helix repeat-containing protein [Polyangiaceae bacterium]
MRRGSGDGFSNAKRSYLIANGTYASSSNVLLWVTSGGTTAVPRYFVGESRDGVIINARATIEADHVVIQNLTFDLTGYVKGGSFNTISIEGANNTTIDRVTFTGDCQTGSTGGHIELNGTVGTVVDSCIVGNFGNCGPDGHLDHGIYVASTQDSVVRNSIVRGNASRGIQFNTQQGDYGTIGGVIIEKNRIYQNGHAEYEDGIAVNGEDTGTIANVTIQHNLIYDKYYSGLRFAGAS